MVRRKTQKNVGEVDHWSLDNVDIPYCQLSAFATRNLRSYEEKNILLIKGSLLDTFEGRQENRFLLISPNFLSTLSVIHNYVTMPQKDIFFK